jgi:hypothetical protein
MEEVLLLYGLQVVEVVSREPLPADMRGDAGYFRPDFTSCRAPAAAEGKIL